jgi:hypothetical protein
MNTDILNRGSIKETCVKTYQKGERTENVDADIFETNSETAASQEGPLCRNDNKQDNAIRDSVSARYCASFHDDTYSLLSKFHFWKRFFCVYSQNRFCPKLKPQRRNLFTATITIFNSRIGVFPLARFLSISQ